MTVPAGFNYCTEEDYATLVTLRDMLDFPQPERWSDFRGKYVRPSKERRAVYKPALSDLLAFIHGVLRAPKFPHAKAVTITSESNYKRATVQIDPSTHISVSGKTEEMACLNLIMELRRRRYLGKKPVVLSMRHYKELFKRRKRYRAS